MNWKKLFTIQKCASGLFWGVYLVNSFVKWELYNPFWWVSEVLTTPWIREIILLIAFVYLVASFIMYHIFLYDDGTFSEKKKEQDPQINW